jgi:hypothetical protein
MTALIALALQSTLSIQQAQVPDFSFNTGTYRIYWDDEIDHELKGNKRCEIEVKLVNGKLSGKFSGLQDREARLTGTLNSIKNATIVSFQQIEDNYICSYQVLFAPQPVTSDGLGDRAPVFMGVWQDTNRRSGDFAIVKYP